jgi:hypothetical protein
MGVALRPGGVLAVITTAAVRHPGWVGQLIMITHSRAAGLVYAQHVIVLHASILAARPGRRIRDRLYRPCVISPVSQG